MRPAALDRRILSLALPALATLLAEPIYELTDTAIVGHLGASQLAGLALAATVLNLVGYLTNFLTMATTSRVARSQGAGAPRRAVSIAAAALATGAGLGVLLGAAVFFAGPPAAALLGGHGATLVAARTYLRVAAVGLPFLLVSYAGTGVLQGCSDTRTPLRIVAVSTAANLALEVLLVYGAGTGIAGSAWGTVAAQLLAAVLVEHAVHRRFHSRARPVASELRLLLADGVPLVGRTLALGAALTTSTALAAHLGTTRLAAHQITMQIWLLLSLALDALAVPAQVFVSTALGADDPVAAREVGRRCLRIGATAGLALAAVTAALAPLLPAVFTAAAPVQAAAVVPLVLCGLQQPFAAAAFVLDGLLLGAGDYAALRRTMLLALLAFAPLAALAAADHQVGLPAIWGALACWLAARAALLGRRWASGRWSPP